MKVLSLSSPLPWIVNRRNWKDFRQAFSPLWSYSQKGRGECISQDLWIYPWTRPEGVRVQKVQKVQKVQRVVVAADAASFIKRGTAPPRVV